VLGELDQFTGQQLQCPTAAACRWLGTGGGDEQGLLLAREFAARSRARFFAERRLQVAERAALRSLSDLRRGITFPRWKSAHGA
jgi:hypothetical protein